MLAAGWHRELFDSLSQFDAGLPLETDRLLTPLGKVGDGLAIRRSILASHGGRLWAISNTECGAPFTTRCPQEFEAQR